MTSLHIHIIILVGCLWLHVSATDYLAFQRRGSVSQKDSIDIPSSTEGNVDIYASWLNGLVPVKINALPVIDGSSGMQPTISFHCFVDNQTEPLTGAELCWKQFANDYEGHPECLQINNVFKQSMTLASFTFDVDYNRYTGFVAKSTWTSNIINRQAALTGIIFCRLRSKWNVVESNYLEFQDLGFYRKAIFTEMKYTATSDPKTEPALQRKKFPISFDCGSGGSSLSPAASASRWMQAVVQSPFNWGLCPVQANGGPSTPDLCHAALTTPSHLVNRNNEAKPVSNLGDTLILPNGTLIIFEPSDAYTQDKVLACSSSVNRKVYITYVGGSSQESGSWKFNDPLKIDNLSPGDSNVQISAGSSLTQSIQLRVGKLDSDFRLFAVYHAIPSKNSKYIRWEWTKDDKPLRTADNFLQKRHTLTFPMVIRSEHAGMYKLKVTQFSPGPETSIVFTYEVSVVAPPVLHDPGCMKPFVYKMEGESVTINCRYLGDVTHVAVYINDHRVDKLDGTMTSRQVGPLTFSNALLGLTADIKVTATGTTDTGSIYRNLSYSVNNLKFNNALIVSNSHMVTFKVGNQEGYVTTSSVIQVIKKPTCQTCPNAFTCKGAGCNVHQQHTIRSVIDPDSTKQYDLKDLVVHQTWMINVTDLQRPSPEFAFTDYFQILEDGRTLVIKPLVINGSNVDDRVRTYIKKSGNFISRIILLAPEAKYLTVSSLDEWEKYNLVIYDSHKDPDMPKSLEAAFPLDIIVKASYLWLIAIIVCCGTALIILIVLFIIWCSRRPEKETYMVDATERKVGLNPAEEAKAEKFLMYERTEDDDQPPDIEKGQKLSIGVALATGDDDDFEADGEDMSFVGQHKDPNLTSS